MKVTIRCPDRTGEQATQCRAFLDGVDVSHECFEVDDQLGYVHVYKRNENGAKYAEGGAPAWECRRGDVRIEVIE